jgi:hypothetical protein
VLNSEQRLLDEGLTFFGFEQFGRGAIVEQRQRGANQWDAFRPSPKTAIAWATMGTKRWSATMPVFYPRIALNATKQGAAAAAK